MLGHLTATPFEGLEQTPEPAVSQARRNASFIAYAERIIQESMDRAARATRDKTIKVEVWLYFSDGVDAKDFTVELSGRNYALGFKLFDVPGILNFLMGNYGGDFTSTVSFRLRDNVATTWSYIGEGDNAFIETTRRYKPFIVTLSTCKRWANLGLIVKQGGEMVRSREAAHRVLPTPVRIDPRDVPDPVPSLGYYSDDEDDEILPDLGLVWGRARFRKRAGPQASPPPSPPPLPCPSSPKAHPELIPKSHWPDDFPLHIIVLSFRELDSRLVTNPDPRARESTHPLEERGKARFGPRFDLESLDAYRSFWQQTPVRRQGEYVRRSEGSEGTMHGLYMPKTWSKYFKDECSLRQREGQGHASSEGEDDDAGK